MKMITIEAATKGAGPNLSAGAVKYCGTGTVLRIEQSIAYMAQHLDQPLQVATLAARANISPSHFFALFKRRIGSAPMDYFTRLRMQRACRLLERTTLSVKEIASELGYDDPFYFSRVFKSVNSMAPSDYRVAQREMSSKAKEFGEASNSPYQPEASTVSGQIQYA
jgi:AraC-like DNA-binding protein